MRVTFFNELVSLAGLEIKNRPIPVIAIPTTAGTGAEMTPYSVITNNNTKQKATIMDYDIYPKFSIVDPNLTSTMPENVSKVTAFDSLAHSLESYISVPNRSIGRHTGPT